MYWAIVHLIVSHSVVRTTDILTDTFLTTDRLTDTSIPTAVYTRDV